MRKCSSNSFPQVLAYIFGDGQDTQFIPFTHSPNFQSGIQFSLILDFSFFPFFFHFVCQKNVFRGCIVGACGNQVCLSGHLLLHLFTALSENHFLLLQLEFSVFFQETPPIFRQPFGVCYQRQKIKLYQPSSQHLIYMHFCPFFIRCYSVSFPHYPSPHKKNESILFSQSLLLIRIKISSQNWALQPSCVFSHKRQAAICQF